MIERIVIKPYDAYDLSTFVIHQDTVYIGHFGGMFDAEGKKQVTIEEQTWQVFRNLEKALQEIHLSLDHLLKVTVILKNMTDFNRMHSVWKQLFTEGYPVRTTITSQFVDEDCLIQIEGIAGREIA